MHVLDTNAAIVAIATRRSSLLNPDAEVCVSIVTHIELLSWKRMPPDELAGVQAFLRRTQVVGITSAVRDCAIALRRDHGLKLPDAIVAGTALAVGGTLVTNDRRLFGVPGLAVQSFMLTP